MKAIKEECFCHARLYCSCLTLTKLSATNLGQTDHLNRFGQLLQLVKKLQYLETNYVDTVIAALHQHRNRKGI